LVPPMSRFGKVADFPKTVENVSDWLQAIGMPQYQKVFAEAGIESAQLRQLTDTQMRELVSVEGHKRRLLLALNALDPLPAAVPALPTPPPNRPKYNSTSSLYIDSTITRPCIDEIIFCVSIVIHDRIEEGERALQAEPTMESRLPESFNMKSKPLLAQLASAEATEDTIFQAIKSIYSIAEFSAECLVISLLYIERLRSLTGLHLLMSNWQPILLAAMIVAQKVWDDKSLLNVDFSLICSAYSLKDINKLEKQFLELVQYNVSISASLYASYYFELRTLCEKAERDFSLKPLSEAQQTTLINRAEQKSSEWQGQQRQSKSLGTAQFESLGGSGITRDES